jgi:hypothetical protein
MKKLIYKITEDDKQYSLEFITDRTPEWTEQQYTRNRINCKMELISNETTKEKEPLSREVRLG